MIPFDLAQGERGREAMKHNKKSHVVYIITKLELGGAQKVCLTLFKELPNAGINSTIIAGSTGKLVDKVQHSPDVILLNSLKREISLTSLWHEICSFFKLIAYLKQLKKEHPNLIVHTHSTKAGILGRWAAWCARIHPRVHTVHGYGFHAHQNRIAWLCIYFLELITSLITTHYVCVSSEDVKTGIRLFPQFAKKHSIIRAAVDWDQFYIPARTTTMPPQSDKPFVFGTISCFKPQKNIFDLLQAFERVHQSNPDTRLEIIGDGILRPGIQAWIAKHKLEHVIQLHGWQEQVAPIMINWHAFVLSSLWEGLPCAVVEARLLTLPVISYNTGGIHDIIFHGENGLLFPQGDWHALSNGMNTLLHDKQLYRTLQNHHEDLSDFKNNQMIIEHQKLYNELI